jgi:hypothetical protein
VFSCKQFHSNGWIDGVDGCHVRVGREMQCEGLHSNEWIDAM